MFSFFFVRCVFVGGVIAFAPHVACLSFPFVVGVVQFAGDFPPIVVVVMLFVDGVDLVAVDIRPSAGVGVLSAGFDYLSAGFYYHVFGLAR